MRNHFPRATLPAATRALITGASSGIGRETAKLLAGEGYELALHYHLQKKAAESLLHELRGSAPAPFLFSADLADYGQIERLVTGVGEHWDSLDVLVQNAGSYPRGLVREVPDADVERTLATNLLGPIRLVRRLLPLLDRSKGARIIFVSSVLAYTGSSHGAAYATAKAGLLGFARSLARELAPRITVHVVAPGAIDTAILAGDTPARRQEREALIPLRRVGSPREVAELIAFLASPRASYLTGSTVHVNGGVYFG